MNFVVNVCGLIVFLEDVGVFYYIKLLILDFEFLLGVCELIFEELAV